MLTHSSLFILYLPGQAPESNTKSKSSDPDDTGSGSSQCQGCATWYLCICLLSQYCILFRLPLGGNSISANKEGNKMKTKKEEANPVWWSLSLADPGSAGVMQTVAPPPQLIAAVTHWGPYIYLFIYFFKWKQKYPNKIMNEWRERWCGLF